MKTFALVIGLFFGFFAPVRAADIGYITSQLRMAPCGPHPYTAVYVAQVVDLASTRAVFQRGYIEADPVSRVFAGKRRQNWVGVAIAMALVDELGNLLTRHAPGARCALAIRQSATSALDALRNTTLH